MATDNTERTPSTAETTTTSFTDSTVSRKAGTEEIARAMTGGIVFKGTKLKAPDKNADRTKTKAKKKGYITGSHGSGAAKKKADIRTRRANRHKK